MTKIAIEALRNLNMNDLERLSKGKKARVKLWPQFTIGFETELIAHGLDGHNEPTDPEEYYGEAELLDMFRNSSPSSVDPEGDEIYDYFWDGRFAPEDAEAGLDNNSYEKYPKYGYADSIFGTKTGHVLAYLKVFLKRLTDEIADKFKDDKIQKVDSQKRVYAGELEELQRQVAYWSMGNLESHFKNFVKAREEVVQSARDKGIGIAGNAYKLHLLSNLADKSLLNRIKDYIIEIYNGILKKDLKYLAKHDTWDRDPIKDPVYVGGTAVYGDDGDIYSEYTPTHSVELAYKVHSWNRKSLDEIIDHYWYYNGSDAEDSEIEKLFGKSDEAIEEFFEDIQVDTDEVRDGYYDFYYDEMYRELETEWQAEFEEYKQKLAQEMQEYEGSEANIEEAEEIVRNHSSVLNEYTDFAIEDGSLSSGGVEIVSKPMKKLKTAFKYLEDIFEAIEENGWETTEQTGFHINVGTFKFPEGRVTYDKFDILKLVLFMGERHLLEKFSRIGNQYVNTTERGNLLYHIGDSGIMDLLAPEGKIDDKKLHIARQKMQDKLLDYAAKYSAINLSKLVKHGYLEFRIVGGENYHKKLKEIKRTIGRYIFALAAARDPQAYRNDYLKKLYYVFDRQLEPERRQKKYEKDTERRNRVRNRKR